GVCSSDLLAKLSGNRQESAIGAEAKTNPKGAWSRSLDGPVSADPRDDQLVEDVLRAAHELEPARQWPGSERVDSRGGLQPVLVEVVLELGADVPQDQRERPAPVFP